MTMQLQSLTTYKGGEGLAIYNNRICQQCGKTFSGDPRFWYCIECRKERRKEAKMELKEIAEYYNQCGSIKGAARYFGISEQSCRRMLINAGVDVCENQKIVRDMLDEGKTLEEIADKLKISVKTVQSYLPYEKGSYAINTSGNKVKDMRIANGLTQRQLADKIGVTQNELSRWESGKVTPKIDKIKLISITLGCSIDDLI